MHVFDSETVNRLADKLTGLELAEDERAALNCILDRAADEEGEVVGFSSFEKQPARDSVAEAGKKVKPPDLSEAGIKIAGALGWRF